MNYQQELSSARVIESTKENQDEIMTAINRIMSGSQSREEIYIAIDDINHKAFLCLYSEPLISKGLDIIHLSRGADGKWS